jgi:zinc protease
MVDKVQIPKLFMVWHSPASYTSGDVDMNLTAQVLAGGVSSRLYQRLVVKDGLATEVSAEQASQILGSMFALTVTPAEGASLQKIEAAIDEEIKRYVAGGPTDLELRRQISGYESATLSSLQSISAKADRLNEFEYAYGEPNSFKKQLDLYRNATPRGVRDTAKKVLDLGSRLILTVVPESTENRADRDKKPESSAEKLFAPTAPTVMTLANGTKVQYVQRPELPLMSVIFRFDTGAVLDAKNEHGLTALATSLATQGAGNLSASEYENALNLIGASVNVGAGARSVTASRSWRRLTLSESKLKRSRRLSKEKMIPVR